jgi:hypothetical protein
VVQVHNTPVLNLGLAPVFGEDDGLVTSSANIYLIRDVRWAVCGQPRNQRRVTPGSPFQVVGHTACELNPWFLNNSHRTIRTSEWPNLGNMEVQGCENLPGTGYSSVYYDTEILMQLSRYYLSLPHVLNLAHNRNKPDKVHRAYSAAELINVSTACSPFYATKAVPSSHLPVPRHQTLRCQLDRAPTFFFFFSYQLCPPYGASLSWWQRLPLPPAAALLLQKTLRIPNARDHQPWRRQYPTHPSRHLRRRHT